MCRCWKKYSVRAILEHDNSMNGKRGPVALKLDRGVVCLHGPSAKRGFVGAAPFSLVNVLSHCLALYRTISHYIALTHWRHPSTPKPSSWL